jgi:hypothetical protein
MNIYSLLRAMVDTIVWKNEANRADAHETINQLEQLNAFGTVAGTMKVVAHEHVWQNDAWRPEGDGWSRRYIMTKRHCIVCQEVEDL